MQINRSAGYQNVDFYVNIDQSDNVDTTFSQVFLKFPETPNSSCNYVQNSAFSIVLDCSISRQSFGFCNLRFFKPSMWQDLVSSKKALVILIWSELTVISTVFSSLLQSMKRWHAVDILSFDVPKGSLVFTAADSNPAKSRSISNIAWNSFDHDG